MSFSSWLRTLRSHLEFPQVQREQRPTRRKVKVAFRPAVELLEDRTLPSTFTVTNTCDAGIGSLRQAITDSDNNPAPTGQNVIEFDIPTSDQGYQAATASFLIQPCTPLPAVTDATLIDGYSQPGATPNTLLGVGQVGVAPGDPSLYGDNAVLKIELSGAVVSSSYGEADGLLLVANSTVQGLAINRWSTGISIDHDDVVQGNFIGTDVTGTKSFPTSYGDYTTQAKGVEERGSGGVVGGVTPSARNVIAGFWYAGVYDESVITGGAPTTVEGNFIGTDRTGTLAFDASGVPFACFTGVSDFYGESMNVSNNLISNNQAAIYNGGSDPTAVFQVQGNFLGTDVTGTQQPSVSADNDALVVYSADAGTLSVVGNLIVGSVVSPTTITLQGNYFGTNVVGTMFFGGNSNYAALGGSNNVVAGNTFTYSLFLGVGEFTGSTPDSDSHIQGNQFISFGHGGASIPSLDYVAYFGLDLDSATSGNTVQNNVFTGLSVGVFVDASAGNTISGNSIHDNTQSGIDLLSGANNNTIGGLTDGAGNTIYANGGDGVEIDSGAGNSILGNVIYANSGLGIDLQPGANQDQSAPVLTNVVDTADGTTITGTLASPTGTTVHVEFFANGSPDPAGRYEGQTYLGSADVAVDASGNFAATLAAQAPADQPYVTATATDPGGDTSEFSADQQIAPPGTFLVISTADSGAGTLRQAITDSDNNPAPTGQNVIEFDIPTSDQGYQAATASFLIQPCTALPAVTDATLIDGYSQPGATPNTLLGVGQVGVAPGDPSQYGDNAVLKIELSGAVVSRSYGAADGLLLVANSTVQGLAINRWSTGISIDHDDVVQGNFIGTDVTGTKSFPTSYGDYTTQAKGVEERGSGGVVGGVTPSARNVIAGFWYAGVYDESVITGGAPTTVEGNFIGTDRTGTLAFDGSGVPFACFTGVSDFYGASMNVSNNLISNNQAAIYNGGSDPTAVFQVQGNFLGTDVTGTQQPSVSADNDALVVYSADAGTLSVVGNLIVGSVVSPTTLTLQGNYFGTNVVGTMFFGGNSNYAALGGSNNVVAGNTFTYSLFLGVGEFTGSTPDSGSHIQGNQFISFGHGGASIPSLDYVVYFGLDLDSATSGNTVQNNVFTGLSVGVFVDASAGNTISGNSIHDSSQSGIDLLSGANNNTIGGLTDGAGNTIYANGGDGVEIDSGAGNSILGNVIYANSGLGIDLQPGANQDQPAPVLTNVVGTASGTTITGTLASPTSTTVHLEFFANGSPDPAGRYEGQTYLGSADVAVDASGNFAATLAAQAPADQPYVTATATDPGGDTSEFSADQQIAPPGTFLVISTADSGAGTLRQAITDSDNNPAPTGQNVIEFDIPTSDQGYQAATASFLIQPLTELPTITDATLIDGYSQPGATPNCLKGVGQVGVAPGDPSQYGDNAVLKIELSGALAPSSYGENYGLVLVSNSTVQGLAVNRWPNAIRILGTDDVVQGNFIGTDVTGCKSFPTSYGDNTTQANGVVVDGGSGAVIGGTTASARNVIAGFWYAGVLNEAFNAGGAPATVEGNFIGTDRTGTLAFDASGVPFACFFGVSDFYGASMNVSNNLISNNQAAIYNGGSDPTAVFHVQGNFLGTDVTGTQQPSVSADNDALVVYSADAGTLSVVGNLIVGSVVSPTTLTLQGNYFGTNVVGTMFFGGNSNYAALGGSNNVVAGNTFTYSLFLGVGEFTGSTPDSGSHIQGNQFISFGHGGASIPSLDYVVYFGLDLDSATSGNTVQNNVFTGLSVGVFVDGSAGNTISGNSIHDSTQSGIDLLSGANNNTIGGLTDGAGNTIYANSGDGVEIDSGAGNSILGNVIYANSGLGIDLQPGANQDQPAPVLTNVVGTASGTTITGTLASPTSTTVHLEFFANGSPDTAGRYEGETYLGSANVAVDAGGNFTAAIAAQAAADQPYITATATDQAGNTSAFSAAFFGSLAVTSNQSAVATSGIQPVANTGGYTSLDGPVTLSASLGTIVNNGNGTWSWSYTPNNGPTQTQTVTITAADPDGNVARTTFALTLNHVPPTASLSGPSAGVLYQPLTFTLGASDLSPADQAGNFTYLVNWGDGTSDTIVGPSSATDAHAYATAPSAPITVTATDQDGGVSQPVMESVTVFATPQIENGILAIPGTAAAATYTLTPTLPTGASAYSMKVTRTVGTTTTNLGTFAVSVIDIYGGPGADAVVLNGAGASNAFTAGNGTVSEQVAQGATQTTAFTVGLNAVTSLTLKGAGSSNSLIGPNQPNTWAITGANAGTLDGLTAFSGIQDLTGGAGADMFSFIGNTASVSGVIDGGGGSNALDFSGRSTAVTVTMVAGGPNKATATGGWTNIAAVIGSAATTNTLVGANISNQWDLTGANTGTLDGTLTFAAFQNLTGGATNDTFGFFPGGSIAGNLKGGAPVNALDYSGYGSPVTVNLQTKTATGIGGVWANIQAIIGTGTTDTLIGANSTSIWSITGANAGNVGAYSFTGFPNLTGGTGNDTFSFVAGGSVSGVVDGQGGSNTLDYSVYGSPITVNLQTTTATAIGGTWANIQSFKGTNTTDTLTATDGTTNTWALKGSNAGTVDDVAFTGLANLTGGSGNDTFIFANGATVTGVVNGMGGSNTLDYSAYTGGVRVNLGNATTDLANSSATGVNGGAANGIFNIGQVIVGAGNNYLTAVGFTASIIFTATGNGNNILVGGSGNNTLTVSGAGKNIVIGGQGVSTISGGTSYNLLIGGYTAYDAVFADLEAILSIWKTVNGAPKYAQAISKLTASTYAYALTDTTVHGNSNDTINAGTHALDWYFTALASEITGENAGETTTLC